MAKFRYQVKDREGKSLKGVVEARDEKQAARVLRERNLIVISLKPEAKGLFVDVRTGILGRVGTADLVKFTRQLATMFSAGLPITDAC